MSAALHPNRDQIELVHVLAALGHPLRLEIVRRLDTDGEQYCGAIMPEAQRSSLTHHWRTLRESGVVCQRPDGRRRYMSLRRDDLDARFPGLLDLVLAETVPADAS